MTVPNSNYPFLLGGGGHGRNRSTSAATSGGAVDAPNRAHAGAYTTVAHYDALSGPGYRTIEDAGIRAGEIIGYRAWDLQSDGRLHSMFAEYLWVPGQVATGNPLQYMRGIHAYKSLDDAEAHYGMMTEVVVLGGIALWGTVIEHEHGYRAEFGTPVSFDRIVFAGPKPRRSILSFWRSPVEEKLAQLRTLYLQPKDAGA